MTLLKICALRANRAPAQQKNFPGGEERTTRGLWRTGDDRIRPLPHPVDLSADRAAAEPAGSTP
jgi:hypothetical protein